MTGATPTGHHHGRTYLTPKHGIVGNGSHPGSIHQGFDLGGYIRKINRRSQYNGIGHNHFLPLASYSRRFARKKLTRVWNRRYHQWYAAFPSVLRELKPYPMG